MLVKEEDHSIMLFINACIFFLLSHTYISPYICFQFPIWFMKLKLFRFLLQLRLEGVEVNEEETVSEPELLMEVI